MQPPQRAQQVRTASEMRRVSSNSAMQMSWSPAVQNLAFILLPLPDLQELGVWRPSGTIHRVKQVGHSTRTGLAS